MKPSRLLALPVLGLAIALATASAQPGGFPGGLGGGFGPPGGPSRKILKDFDKNNDGWLNADERKLAREEAKKGGRRGGFGPKGGGPGGFGGRGPETKPGPKVEPKDVTTYPTAKLYDPTILRTLFLEFENKDWEQEMEDFHGTDVDVPCTLTVDGKTYKTVGVHFRGMSSYGMVRAGAKRSLNLSLDTADKKQRLYGAKTLNLLNGHEDPTFLSTALYSHVANQYLPTPKANMVKVVINGESWGVYASVQQFDKVFLKENFKTEKGTRWKVRGSPRGGGGLEYLGDDVAQYKQRYEMKSKDDPKAWAALINLCKVLNTTPADKLEAALRPICDVDGLLWFLAVDVGLINCDGYWIRASDFSIYLDDKGKFHMVPHDMNEAFRAPQGPGMGGGGPGGRGGPGGGRGGFAPRPGEVLPPPVAEQLRLTDEQKKQLEALQKETDEQLGKLMTEAQRKQFQEMKARGPGGPPGGGFPGGPGGGFPGGPGGPGGGGMGAAGGFALDPLVGLTDTRKPLRSKVLAVPALREQYLKNIRTLAEKSLDWKNLGPVVASYRTLLEKEIAADTRKLEPLEAFLRTTADNPPTTAASGGRGRGETALRTFADQRRKALLENPDVKKLPK